MLKFNNNTKMSLCMLVFCDVEKSLHERRIQSGWHQYQHCLIKYAVGTFFIKEHTY